MINERLHFDPVITGLRAYSVVAVLLFHFFHDLFPWLAGYKGVDVFFVISGYLIIGHINKSARENEFSLLTFYAKRIVRLFPALLILLFIVFGLGYMFLLSEEFLSLAKYIFGSIFFFTNIISWGVIFGDGEGVNYFHVNAEVKPLLHMWSLGVEEQFYATFPLLVVLLIALKRRILPYLALLTLLSAMLSFAFSGVMPGATFYLLPTRFWEIGLGGIIAIAAQNKSWINEFRFRFKCNIWIGIILICASLSFQFNSFPFLDIVLAVLGAACILINTKQEGFSNLILNNRVTDVVGRISYPLYIFHFPVIASYAIVGGIFTVSQKIGVLILLFIFSYIVYRFVEIPFAKAPRRLSLIILGVLSLIIVTASSYVYLKSGLPDRITGNKELNTGILGFHEYKEKYESCSVAESPFCLMSANHSITPPRIVLLGDSHADHSYPGIADTFNKENVMLLGMNSCPPLKGIISYGDDDKDRKRCTKLNDRVSKYVVENDSIEVVVLAFAMPYYYAEKGLAFQHLGAGEPMLWNVSSSSAVNLDRFQSVTKSLGETVDYYLRANKKVVLMLDVPEMPFMPAYCVGRMNLIQTPVCAISEETYLKRQESMRNFIASEFKSKKNIFIYDPLRVFCENGTCNMRVGNKYLFRDSNHLSLWGATKMGRDFYDFFKDNNL